MPPKKPVKKVSTANTQTTLALSSLHLRLEGLEDEHEKLLKKIQRKRKELDNFVEQVRTIAVDLFSRTHPPLEKIQQISAEIHMIFQDILERKKLSSKNKKKVQKVYVNLMMAGIITPKPRDEEDEEDEDEAFFEEDEDEEYDSYSEEYEEWSEPRQSQTSQTKDETRQIRQTFLRLAEIFHPDKTSDPETQMRNTEIMKEINKAYQDRDFARLLELEKKYLDGKNIELDTSDDLGRRCEVLERTNLLLKEQYEGILAELKMVKRTPQGEMVMDYRRAKREQVDMVDVMVEKLEQQIDFMQEIRDFVKNFRDNKISLKEFLEGPECEREMRQSMMEDFLSEILEDLE